MSSHGTCTIVIMIIFLLCHAAGEGRLGVLASDNLAELLSLKICKSFNNLASLVCGGLLVVQVDRDS